MQSNPVVVICSNWRTYNIYNITLSIPCSGVFCAWVVQRQSDNRFCDHPSFVQKSFIWPLLAAFSSAYILAFLYISFHDSDKFFDLCKVIHSKSISSKSISLIFLPPPSSFFAILPWFFELTLFCIWLSLCIHSFILFLSTRISTQLLQLITFLHALLLAV